MKVFLIKVLDRLKSPVVILQLVSIIAGAVIFFQPSLTDVVKEVAGIIIAIINIFAGLNNPTDTKGF